MIHYMTSDGVGQPWVANELRRVEAGGIPFRLHAMRAPKVVHFTSPWVAELNGKTNVLYPISMPRLIVSAFLGPFLFGARYFKVLWNGFFGRRETLRGRMAALAHFFVACDWARRMRKEPVSHVHAQWAYSSGTLGMYGAWLLGTSFSFTGHATDLFRDRVALEDKIRRADFIICISTFHRDFYLQNGADTDQLEIAYCGIDPHAFSLPEQRRSTTGSFRILSSGRLVEKKGFGDLIEACAILRDRGLEFECVIAGSGPLEQDLNARILAAGLTGRVQVTGEPLTQEQIPTFMHSGDVYCLPCVWAPDGDVDGLPQMLMEAMACGCPAVSTRLVGIPDLIVHQQTGLLVEPGQPQSLADELLRLASDASLADRLRAAGRAIIEAKFDLETCLEPLLARFRRALEPGKGAP